MSTCKPTCPPGCYCMRRMARERPAMTEMVHLPAAIYRDLVGKPFVKDARGPNSFDCLGLAMEIARRRGFAIPEYESTAQELARSAREGALGPCVQIERPEPGAVVLLRSVGGPADRHIAVMLDHRRMIHACEIAGQVVIENLIFSGWSRRLLGFYRLEAKR